MSMAQDKWRAGALMACIVVAFACPGCGPKVSARVEHKTVTKWKYQPKSSVGIPKGLIVEEQGDRVTATFCDLKPTEGFEVQAPLAHGQYVANVNAIIIPLGMPVSATLEQWLQLGGPHLAVPFDARAPRLIGTLAASGTSQSFEFVAYQQ
jgi:hypothetical protein